jgi:hypothetical protein
LIKPHMATAQDVFDHKIKVGNFDGPPPLQPLEEVSGSIASPKESPDSGSGSSSGSSHSSHSSSSHSSSSGDQARGFTYRVAGSSNKRTRID